MNDPIVDEVRRVRDALAARFNYDLHAIFKHLKEREKQSGFVFVDGVAKPPAQSGIDLVKLWQTEELARGRPDINDSQSEARRLRAQAENRGT